jgi:hypothetical protein
MALSNTMLMVSARMSAMVQGLELVHLSAQRKRFLSG